MIRYQLVGLLGMLVFVVAGCGAMTGGDGHMGMAGMADHAGMAEHSGMGMADHAAMAAAHAIPEEDAAVPNPVPVSDASIAAGQALYNQNCATCHGAEGEGDGAAAAGLNPKPADLHAAHVQQLTDGALFYIITHGREGTAMVAWETTLSEEQRWEVVNFLRTFEAETGR